MNLIFDIGLVVTSMIAKYFIGENWIISTIAAKGIENLIDRGENVLTNSSKKDAQEIRKVAEKIIKGILPAVKAEYGAGDFSPVFIEFTNTIGALDINNELLSDLNFDSKLLFRYIKESSITKRSVKARFSFSEKEESLYNDLINSFCREIVRVAVVLDDFEVTVSRKQLANQGKILAILSKIYDRPKKEDREYEEVYCRELAKQLDKLEMFGIRRVDDFARQQSLSIAYTTIEIEQRSEEYSDMRGYSVSVGRNFKKPTMKNLSVDRILQEGKRLLVIGDPGSGKTTLLKWIAIQLSEGYGKDSKENRPIPFFIKLRECVETGLPAVEDFPRQTLKMLSGKPENWAHRILEMGRGIVLIDGVDEMPVSSRKELLNTLEQLISAYPLSRYIITSRPSAVRENIWIEWKEWVRDERFIKASMQPMSRAQIGVFINKWFAALDASLSEENKGGHNIEGLKRLLKTRIQLFRLATNPLLCAMICALYKERGETLPSERIQLYAECVEMLLQKRDEVRKIRMDDYKDLPYSRKITVIQDLAWWMMQNNFSEADIDKAESYLDKELKDMGIQGSITSKDVSKFLLERTGLLREETVGKISFAHRTFQEYLAAQSAVSHFNLSFLLSVAKDDQWRETIILACGEARPRERGEFLESLIDLSKDLRRDGRRNVALLALACLETCTTIDPFTVREKVLDYAFKFFPPQDMSEAQSIALAGDFATNLLYYNKKHDPKTKTYCINALAQIGTSAALAVLEDYANDMSPIVSKSLIDSRKYFNESEYIKVVLEKTKCFVFHGMDEVSLLRKIKSLIYVDVYSSKISDLSFFENHLELKYLDVHQTKVRDLSPLSKLNNLQYLDIRGTEVVNLKPLSKLKNLKTLLLDFKTNYDVSVLSHLDKLEIVRRGSTASTAGDEDLEL